MELKQQVLCKPKYSMTALDLRAAPHCGTGHSKGRYRARIQSQLLLLHVPYLLFLVQELSWPSLHKN